MAMVAETDSTSYATDRYLIGAHSSDE